ncbi:MAG: DUF411 domain-containing protein [Pseudotabrizicola sp.]|jgi:hypothetical protein|uniref:DUF411 domain-containing protein n=1 Tax=Pseudotabrizicola sp. TaxID=2939647 RepID=UPI002ACD5571|nr:DUF411 domain-containing protein [Pseudotabrizicola sp.]MDZ7573462.1 DUF411 domain-containing protein [Pseudotabrizicola sp.]
MTGLLVKRREFMFAAAAFLALPVDIAHSQVEPPIHVVKGRGCECCEAWVDYLREQGFTVTDEVSMGTLLIRYKMDQGVPVEAFSCHTGTVDGYVLEGHVPAADIRRLLVERPDAFGLSVPDMPYGSPGMGSEDSRDAYDVLLIKRDGSLGVFTSYPSA